MILTKRETEVLKLKKRGFRQKNIATKLHISQPGVSGLYTNALKKIKEAKETVDFAKELKIEIE